MEGKQIAMFRKFLHKKTYTRDEVMQIIINVLDGSARGYLKAIEKKQITNNKKLKKALMKNSVEV